MGCQHDLVSCSNGAWRAAILHAAVDKCYGSGGAKANIGMYRVGPAHSPVSLEAE